MSIELPPIPPQPTGEGATPAAWDVYLRILALHSTAGTQAAINAQTAQMALMTAAAVRSGDLMQQLLDQPAPTSTGFSESFVMSLLRLVLEKPEAPAP